MIRTTFGAPFGAGTGWGKLRRVRIKIRPPTLPEK
jgi:hypothetical protein